MGRWKPNSQIRIEGDQAYVSLTRGFEAIIDIDDIPIVKDFRWACYIGRDGHAYAYRSEAGRMILMHRALMNAEPGQQVGHRNGDGLRNRRDNLRLVTPTLSMANKAVERRNKIGLKGVSESRGKFRATITPEGKKVHLGTYETAAEAAAAYRGAAKALWGDFAKE